MVKPHAGVVRIAAIKRQNQTVTFVFTCTASVGRTCAVTFSASESGYLTQTKHLTVRGGSRHQLKLTLKPRRQPGKRRLVKVKRGTKIKVVVRSGAYRYSRTL